MKRIILFLALICTACVTGQRLNHHPRIRIDQQDQYPTFINQPLKKHIPSPSPGMSHRTFLLKKQDPLEVLKTHDEIDEPWSWILFIIFLICLLATVLSITLAFAAPTSILLVICTIIAASTFAVGMTMLAIILANQPPDPPPSLLTQ